VNRTSANGVTGYPSRASISEGKRLHRWLVEDLTAIVRRGLREEPPLSASYFESVVTARGP
jgi:creatinine amidohydrolase